MGINDAGMKTDALNPPQYSHRRGAKQASGGLCRGFLGDLNPGPSRPLPNVKHRTGTRRRAEASRIRLQLLSTTFWQPESDQVRKLFHRPGKGARTSCLEYILPIIDLAGHTPCQA